MHPQLKTIDDELSAALERFHRLVAEVPHARWSEAPAPGRWSVAQCVHHLNLTSRAMLPELESAVARARETGGGAPARFRRGVVGWMICRASQPDTRMKSRTKPSFDPPSAPPPAEIEAEFERHQAAQRALLASADGLPLHRVKVRSPFGPVSYNAFAALSILSAHQLRHLAQAEAAAGAHLAP